jgi:hypothetical protein
LGACSHLRFELLIAGNWVRTRLEYDHQIRDYYAVEPGVLLCEGLGARVMDRRDWFF